MTKPSRGNPTDPIIVIRGLRIEAGGDGAWEEIVHGIDLELHPGEVLGLIGESGAGKSTIGLAAMGYARSGVRICGGEIVFDGRDLLKVGETERRRLRGRRAAYVAQSAAAAFNPAHRLIDQCVEVPLLKGQHDRRSAQALIQDLFARLQLPEPKTIGQRYPHQLSGGQLQRAMTAMAMGPHPEVIIFDEPTTALDVTTQVEVLAAIRAAVRDLSLSAIYISHDLAVVAQIADRIMVLRHGSLVESGPTTEILSAPKQEYTKRLVALRQFQKQHVAVHSETILTIRNIELAFGDKPALADVSLDAGVGETVAIVGESGSGKSTLARVIAGLLQPERGTVSLSGERLPPDYRNRTRDQLRRIQLVHQSPDTALNPQQSVRKILGRAANFYFGLRGNALADRIRELLKMVELDPDRLLDRKPEELSGGQKQRLCIARAIAADPVLLICDEVTSALDPLVAEEILKLLDRLQRERRLTYLFITHDIATVRAIADRVAVFQAGRVVEQGSKEQVLLSPTQAYTETLLSSTPEMDTHWLDGLLARRGSAKT
ncbi:peptide/nickel transport system ATP-binding protein [Rhodoligotrophos appendicifer]|uniref:ABC transporter ATP-binding protein n=1 Tax=Rhodoligotrophos appendicifer TaxID=987056 RepID=UPI001184F9BF|nr:ABC transporter ATP-binding protein [Rhodoligotrophos appendicifer]